MKAIILAAGGVETSNPQKFCADKPTCLLTIENSTLLDIQIDTLYASGIEDLVIVRGYCKDKINHPGIRYYDNSDYEKTNVLYSLMMAAEEMNDECLILYSDIVYEKELLERIATSKHDISLGVTLGWQEAFKQRPNLDPQSLELVNFDANNQVNLIGKNTFDASNKSQGVYNGIIKLSQRGCEIFKRNIKKLKQNLSTENYNQLWLTDVLKEMAWMGVPLNCVINQRGWLEIQTQEDYERAQNDADFIQRFLALKTDWANRSKVYDQLEWVNREDFLSTLVEIADLQEGQSVLDLGTGTGKIITALKQAYPQVTDFHGIDISPEMMDKIDPALNFTLNVSTIEDIDCYPDEQFDLITARMVFHHSNNLEKAMQEVWRLLKPQGRFILCEGNPPSNNSYNFYKEMFHYKEDRHVFFENDLINLLVHQGFSNITTRTVIYPNSSLNNWLSNSGLPFRNINIIKKMHYDCPPEVKKAYNMQEKGEDILMDWKFSVVYGSK